MLKLKDQQPEPVRSVPNISVIDRSIGTMARPRPAYSGPGYGGLAMRTALLIVLIQQSLFFLTESNLVKIGTTSYALHYIHLVFHEAGHVLLMWTPPLIEALGGTLGQLAMPVAISVSFIIQRNWFGAAVFAWLLGHSIADCAPYINDARALQLDLITGGTGAEVEGHDWEYLLGTLNLLPKAIRIARWVFVTGRLVMLASLSFMLGWLAFHAIRRWRHEQTAT